MVGATANRHYIKWGIIGTKIRMRECCCGREKWGMKRAWGTIGTIKVLLRRTRRRAWLGYVW